MEVGWLSNFLYALLGSVRAVAQSISHEVSMSLILISCLLLVARVNLVRLLQYQCSHRTPFDTAEQWSELVSGFNVKYGAAGFALLFMAECKNILFMRFLSTVVDVSYLFTPPKCWPCAKI
uniref:NADH-ubiquinone oxidoreductase chain 1 n=1 Tax=Octopus bimaculoides TaxID=37653 RepID=A0A0L8IBG2_OCTBM